MKYVIFTILGLILYHLVTIYISYKLADVDNPQSIFYCYKNENMKSDLICLFCVMPLGNILLVALSKLLFESE